MTNRLRYGKLVSKVYEMSASTIEVTTPADMVWFIQNHIEAVCPTVGVHQAVRALTYRIKCMLKDGRLAASDEVICAAVKTWAWPKVCTRRDEGEFASEIERLWEGSGQAKAGGLGARRGGAVSEVKIEAVHSAEGGSIVGMMRASPVQFEGKTQPEYNRMVLNLLFPDPEGLICCGRDQRIASTRKVRDWAGVACKQQFVVPGYANGHSFVRGDKVLRRCKEMFPPPHRFIVVEFDGIADKDVQASMHSHLSGVLPLILTVDSGGKSVHGWYATATASESLMIEFCRQAGEVGADSVIWHACPWVRMPFGTRPANKDKGTESKVQRVLYFDPAQIGK